MHTPELGLEVGQSLLTVARFNLAPFEATSSLPRLFEPRHFDLVCSLGRERVEQRFSYTTTLVDRKREGLVEHLLCGHCDRLTPIVRG